MLCDLLEEVSFLDELLRLPAYCGPRQNVEFQAEWELWQELYGQEKDKRRALRDLRRKKWVNDCRKGDKVIISLSSNALVVALKQRIIQCTEEIEDGKVCMISFDIPEGAKIRGRWRSLIRTFDFTRVHDSLYSTKYTVINDMRAMVKLLGIEEWVKVFIVEKK